MVGGSGTVAGGWGGDVPVGNGGVIHDGGREDGAAVTPEGPTVGASNTVGGNVEVIRRFLCKIGGVPVFIVETGTCAGLVGYVQGGFA